MFTRLLALSLFVLALMVSACATTVNTATSPSSSTAVAPESAQPEQPVVTEEYARKALICKWTGKWSAYGNSVIFDVKEITNDNRVLGTYTWGAIMPYTVSRWGLKAGSRDLKTANIWFFPPDKIIWKRTEGRWMWFVLQPDGRLEAKLKVPASDAPMIDATILSCQK